MMKEWRDERAADREAVKERASKAAPGGGGDVGGGDAGIAGTLSEIRDALVDRAEDKKGALSLGECEFETERSSSS